MNEKEFKDAARLGGHSKACCSVTGRPCKCKPGCGCAARSQGLDRVPDEAVQWAKTAHVRLDTATSALEIALDLLKLNRQYPAPEWREVGRLVEAARSLLEETLV